MDTSHNGFPSPFIIFTVWVAFTSGLFLTTSLVQGASDSAEEMVLKEDVETTPLPPAPEFVVYEDGDYLPCVLVSMDATIVIEPKRTANKKITVNVPRSAEAAGDCGKGEDSKIILSWNSFRFTWHFQKSRVSDAWYIDYIELSYNTSDKAFDNDPKGTSKIITAAKTRIFGDRHWENEACKLATTPKPNKKQDSSKQEPEVEIVQPLQTNSLQSNSEHIGADDASKSKSARCYSSPAEEKLRKEILDLSQDIAHLTEKKNTDLASTEQLKGLQLKSKELRLKESSLKHLLNSRERQRRKRENDRKIFESNPDIAAKFKRRSEIGRPRCETEQPELLKTIIDIATFGAAADERRRSEALRSIKSLDELTSKLHDEGYKISRSAVYIRLLPKRSNSSEGKRHVLTVPVRLKRAFNDAHRSHADTNFCRATIGYLEDIASVLGPGQVLFISQDDKARVPIGITAANKQAPMLMHVDYRVVLPDHDWVVAERHKLIPSVYGIIEVKSNMMGDRRAVTYSGPTFISIRSGKHCSSTASSHGRDFDNLMLDDDFNNFTRIENGEPKPIVILVVDGGPDENPRYEKVISEAIETFKKHNLDGMFIATNAPGRSAFNRVERRMAPLSRELCGVILEHDHFGTHLDEQGRTRDEELELKNFEHAGKTLAEIWSSVVIDKFPTKAVYVHPENSNRESINVTSSDWKRRHIRESHYFLQIVKCDDLGCCRPKRSTYFKIFPRFIPGPVCIDQNDLTVNANGDLKNQFTSLFIRLQANDSNLKHQISGEVPFDICCPSIMELISARLCSICGLYFASVKSVKAHKRECRPRPHSALDADAFGLPILGQRRNNRPVRVAARRGQERMILWTSRLNDQHADWFDETDIMNVEIEEPSETLFVQSNILDVSTHMNIPWEPQD